MPIELCEVRGCSGTGAKTITIQTSRAPEYVRVCIECGHEHDKTGTIQPKGRVQYRTEKATESRRSHAKPKLSDGPTHSPDNSPLVYRVRDILPKKGGMTIKEIVFATGSKRFQVEQQLQHLCRTGQAEQVETGRGQPLRFRRHVEAPKVVKASELPRKKVEKPKVDSARKFVDLKERVAMALTDEPQRMIDIANEFNENRERVSRALRVLRDDGRSVLTGQRTKAFWTVSKTGEKIQELVRRRDEISKEVMRLKAIVKEDDSLLPSFRKAKADWLKVQNRLEELGIF